MLIGIALMAFLQIAIAHECHSFAHTMSKVEARSAISILYPDGNSGVRGIVTIHQQHELAPLYL